MANIILNAVLGRAFSLIKNVDDNSPVAAVLRLHLWLISAADDALRDLGSLAGDHNIDDFEAISGVAEATGYSNVSMDDSDITITLDDTGNTIDVVYADQTFTSVGTGQSITDMTLSYDVDGTDTDTATEVLHVYDFVVTSTGGDIVADFPATPAYELSQG